MREQEADYSEERKKAPFEKGKRKQEMAAKKNRLHVRSNIHEHPRLSQSITCIVARVGCFFRVCGPLDV